MTLAAKKWAYCRWCGRDGHVGIRYVLSDKGGIIPTCKDCLDFEDYKTNLRLLYDYRRELEDR